MSKKEQQKLTNTVTVEFQQDFINSRGAPIAGAKGTQATYPWTPELQKLIDSEGDDGEPILKVVKTMTAAERNKAKSAAAAKRETAAAK